MGATPGMRPLTWDDLLAFEEDGLRREIIGGELFASSTPAWRHQRVVPDPVPHERGETIAPPHLPGLMVAADDVLDRD